MTASESGKIVRLLINTLGKVIENYYYVLINTLNASDSLRDKRVNNDMGFAFHVPSKQAVDVLVS